ncbi:hypothetical protein PROFUN_03953 [Planoprotostelium fungivorum]|uniref:Uncharacterized protein n=1 Tax=Planoprotostelium fungivorum TaxID=1890364 RepID=A0A2P6MTV4_9EUKA|nr:hypothetical protein PROFUN_03953 [Planoprotostelium fungivorum]
MKEFLCYRRIGYQSVVTEPILLFAASFTLPQASVGHFTCSARNNGIPLWWNSCSNNWTLQSEMPIVRILSVA